jgi:hypothetical protein
MLLLLSPREKPLMVMLLSLALFFNAPKLGPLFLDTGFDVEERIALEDEDPAVRPSLSTVRRLLEQRRAGQEIASLGPIGLAGFSFARELQLSPSVRVIVVSCFLGGGLLAFGAHGRMLASFRTWQILEFGLAALDDGHAFVIVTLQEDVRGTGLNIVRHNVDRFRKGRFQRLWQGLDHGHVGGWGGDDEQAEGFFRFSETDLSPPEIRQLVRNLKTGQEYVRTWRLRGDRFVLLSDPPR